MKSKINNFTRNVILKHNSYSLKDVEPNYKLGNAIEGIQYSFATSERLERVPLSPVSFREDKIFSVLIDDEKLNHSTWKLVAENKNKKVVTVFNEAEFFTQMIPFDTPIYVDRNLKNGILGETVIRNLHEAGYKDLSIYSGGNFTKDDFKLYPYIRGVFKREEIEEIFS